MRLFGYTPERGAAAGDTMPFFHAGKWHLFFSQPPVDAWEYVERARVSTAYIRSDDLVNWEVMPDAFGPGEHGECDGDGIWTGSVGGCSACWWCCIYGQKLYWRVSE